MKITGGRMKASRHRKEPGDQTGGTRVVTSKDFDSVVFVGFVKNI